MEGPAIKVEACWATFAPQNSCHLLYREEESRGKSVEGGVQADILDNWRFNFCSGTQSNLLYVPTRRLEEVVVKKMIDVCRSRILQRGVWDSKRCCKGGCTPCFQPSSPSPLHWGGYIILQEQLLGTKSPKRVKIPPILLPAQRQVSSPPLPPFLHPPLPLSLLSQGQRELKSCFYPALARLHLG